MPTRSMAAGFGRHGMPPPASNDTCTALGQDGSDWSHDLATLTFDLGGQGACGWCGSSSSIRVPSLKLVGLAVLRRGARCVPASVGLVTLIFDHFDLETGVRVATKVGNLPSKFRHARPLGSRIICYVRDGRTDRSNAYCPFPTGGNIKALTASFRLYYIISMLPICVCHILQLKCCCILLYYNCLCTRTLNVNKA